MTVVPGYRRILAVDPSVRNTGWAILDAYNRRIEKIIKTGEIQRPQPKDVDVFAETLTKPEVKVDLVAIEDQYMGKNVKVLMQLTEMRVRYQHSFEIRGVPVIVIPANDWQLGLLEGFITRASVRDERKTMAMQYVHMLFDKEKKIKSSDVCDAICIGVWAIKNNLQGARR